VRRTNFLLQRTIISVIVTGEVCALSTNGRKDDERRAFARCSTCSAIVIADVAGPRADANVACASCGLTLADQPLPGGDYFDLIMRVGRPVGRGARPRRS
jgi:DNA-directed RNA polymerase subunit RPC12/RpoP